MIQCITRPILSTEKRSDSFVRSVKCVINIIVFLWSVDSLNHLREIIACYKGLDFFSPDYYMVREKNNSPDSCTIACVNFVQDVSSFMSKFCEHQRFARVDYYLSAN